MNDHANGHSGTLPVPGRNATVTFRPYATWHDEKGLFKTMRDRPDDEDPGDRAYAFRVERTLLMIESWTLTDRAGRPLPLDAETLERGIGRSTADWLDKEAQRRFDGRPGDEEGPFDTRSPQPSTATP